MIFTEIETIWNEKMEKMEYQEKQDLSHPPIICLIHVLLLLDKLLDLKK